MSRRSRFRLAGVVLGLGGLILVGLNAVPNRSVRLQAEQARAELRSEGFRLEYDSFPWIEDAEAVRRGRRALALAGEMERASLDRSRERMRWVRGDAAVPGGLDAPPPEDTPGRRAMGAGRRPSEAAVDWGRVREMARLVLEGPLQFPPDRSRGTIEVGYLHGLKSLGRHLAEGTLAAWPAGDAAGAGECLEALTVLATRPLEVPLAAEYLQSLQLQEVAFEVTWEALRAGAWSDEALAGLQRRWRNARIRDPLPDIVALARVEALTVCREARLEASVSASGLAGDFAATCLGAWNQPSRILAWLTATWRLWRMESQYRHVGSYLEEAELCRTYREMERSMREGATLATWAEARTHPATTVSRLALPPGGPQRLRFSEGPGPDTVAVEFPATESLLAKAFEADARRNLVIAGLALERHRLRHGTWPATFESLDPATTGEPIRDPMDGERLRYRRVSAGDGVVHSVGLDLVDDGGQGQRLAVDRLPVRRAPDLVWPRSATPEERAADEVRRRAGRRSRGVPWRIDGAGILLRPPLPGDGAAEPGGEPGR